MVQAVRKALLAGLLTGYICLGGAAPYVALNDSGTWRQTDQIYINDASTWRRIRRSYVNDSGTWRKEHIGLLLTNRSLTCLGGQISIRVRGDTGKVQYGGIGGDCNAIAVDEEWSGLVGGDTTLDGCLYETRVVIVSGPINTDPEFNDPEIWYCINGTNGGLWFGINGNTGTGTWRLDIRDAVTDDVRVSATLTVTQ